MYCENCGAKIPDNVEFCSSCGARQPSRQQAFTEQNQANQTLGESTQLKMKWFKFLIYFALFAGAVLNFVSAALYLTGNVYAEYGSDAASRIYSVFPSLKTLDVFYGLALVALGLFGIYTRFQLSSYKRIGPACLLASYGAGAVVGIIYVMAASAVLGESCFNSSTISSIASSVVMILANRAYFNKRASLFVN